MKQHYIFCLGICSKIIKKSKAILNSKFRVVITSGKEENVPTCLY